MKSPVLFRVLDKIWEWKLSQAPRDLPQPPSIASPAALRYPLGPTITSILFTWMGLAAAALGVKWGNAPAAGDALREAWVYVGLMAVLGIGLAWPMIARTQLPRGQALWQGGSMLIGAIPSLVVAAFLSGISLQISAATAGMLIGVALLAAGCLMGGRVGLVLLAAWIAGGPVAAFIWQDFLGGAPKAWIAVSPCIAISRVASGGSLVTAWLVAIVHGAAGCALLARRVVAHEDLRQKERPPAS